MRKLNIIILGFSILFAAGFALAQEETTALEEVALDEEIQPQDLGISEPNVLPDSPFYFFKELGRGVQTVFTFDSLAKAKLKEKISNEKLVELQKMVKQNKNQRVVEGAIANYQNGVEDAKKVAEKIKQKVEENPEVGKFLDKFIQQQTLQQRILQKLETQVATSTFERIKEAREQHLEKFGEVMNRLESKEKIQERLEQNLEKIKGSEFKNFKNLEVLKELEEKVPEEAKEAIQKAQENALKRLKVNLEKMSTTSQERFNEYIEKIGGDKERQMEILENLKTQIRQATQTPAVIKLQEKLETGTTNILKKIEKRVEELNCPSWWPTPSGFCTEGRMVIIKDENGCPLPPKCIEAAETCDTLITCQMGYTVYDTGLKNSQGCPIKKCVKTDETTTTKPPEAKPVEQVCIMLWDPVCGKNGKTYSNACMAKSSGIEIDYRGICKGKINVSPLPLETIKQAVPSTEK